MNEEERAKRNAYGREWRLRHPGHNTKYARAWDAAHPDRALEIRRAHRDKHREEYLTYMRIYNLTYVRKWDSELRARARARTARWAAANPARAAARRKVNLLRRRARLAGGGGSHTTQEWLEKCALLGNVCIYCGRGDVALTRDHKVPIARGGTDYIENLVPACIECNSAKHTKTATEFLARVA